ncbi:MAG: T9SS type A sorting domain-containing protein [Bacteroidetes bacterium]|nr:T9SS type A sorting domain-containing protein [Bacteroidota bacterium]
MIEDSVVFTLGSDGILMNHSVQLVSCQESFYQDCPFLENVNEVTIESSVTIYPNPSSGTVSLIFKDNYTPNSIDLLNITGVLIKSFNYSDFYSGSVNLPDMPDGIYLLKFRSDQGISVEKICIQKS